MIQSAPLASVFAALALVSVIELVWLRRPAHLPGYIADREAQAIHVLMNGGMALMFAPFYDGAIGEALWIALAAAIAAVVARLAWSLWSGTDGRVGGTIFHLVGLAAMLWALGRMPGDMGAMMHHAARPSLAAWVLAALFLIDGVATAALVAFAPRRLLSMAETLSPEPRETARPRRAAIRALRLAAIPHCAMDGGMVLMLLPLML